MAKYEGVNLTFQTVHGKSACFKHNGSDIWIPLSQIFDPLHLAGVARDEDVFVQVEKWVLKEKGVLE